MTPVFAWGILGPDSAVKPMCTFLKVTIHCSWRIFSPTNPLFLGYSIRFCTFFIWSWSNRLFVLKFINQWHRSADKQSVEYDRQRNECWSHNTRHSTFITTDSSCSFQLVRVPMIVSVIYISNLARKQPKNILRGIFLFNKLTTLLKHIDSLRQKEEQTIIIQRRRRRRRKSRRDDDSA